MLQLAARTRSAARTPEQGPRAVSGGCERQARSGGFGKKQKKENK
jgi:hypothetical protein